MSAILHGRRIMPAPAKDVLPLYAATALGGFGSSANSHVKEGWRGFGDICDMCVGPEWGDVVQLYGEQHEMSKRWRVGRPNSPSSVDRNINIWLRNCCSDANLTYKSLESSGADFNNSVAIIAHDSKTGIRHIFPNPQVLQFAGPFGSDNYNDGAGTFLNRYDSAIAISQDKKGVFDAASVALRRIAGLAVQQTSNLLAVCYEAQNKIDFYDKTTPGQMPLFTLSVPSPSSPDFAPNGDLWVVSAGQAVVYKAVGGMVYTRGIVLMGTGTALKVSVSRLGDTIRVSGTSAQPFTTFWPDGTSKPNFAVPLVNNLLNPVVSNYSVLFRYRAGLAGINGDPLYNTPQAGHAECPDGSFWLHDPGNHRWLHYSALYTYIEQITYLPDLPIQALNQSDPSCLLINNKQYKIDWSQFPQAGDQSLRVKPSWKQTHNWALPDKYFFMKSVITLPASDGTKRTFALARNKDYDLVGNKCELIELPQLPATGPARPTGQLVDSYGNTRRDWNVYADLHNDGSTTYCLRVVDTTYPGETCPVDGYVNNSNTIRGVIFERPFLGSFDSSHNPVWGDVVKQVDWMLPANGPVPGASAFMGTIVPRTPTGNYVIFHPQQEALGYYHVGFIKAGETAYNRVTLPNGHMPVPDDSGTYPDNTSGSNFGGLTGICAQGTGRYVVVSYNGQGGDNSNQKYLYDENGVFLKQFGRTSDGKPDLGGLNDIPLGYANNSLTVNAVQVSDRLNTLSHDEIYTGKVNVVAVKVEPFVPVLDGSTPNAYINATTAAQPGPASYTNRQPGVQILENGANPYASTGPDIVFENQVFGGTAGKWMIWVAMAGGRQVVFNKCVFIGVSSDDTFHIETGSRVRVTNCRFLDESGIPVGQKRAHALYSYNARSIEFRNNYLDGVGGCQVRNTYDYTGLEKVDWRFNRYKNICGGNFGGGDSGEYHQMLQLVGITEAPNVEVAWNQIVNLPGESRVEDNINLFECSGTTASPFNIHDNFVWGGYSLDYANAPDSGSGLTTDAGGPSVALINLPHNIIAQNNQFVGTNNAGMNIAAGYNIQYCSNRIVNSATTANGTPVPGAYSGLFSYRPDFGAGNPTYSDAQFHDNVLSGNYVNFKPHPYDPVDRGAVGPGSTKPGSANDHNTYVSTATYADEVAEFTQWQQKLSANQVLIGPLSV